MADITEEENISMSTEKTQGLQVNIKNKVKESLDRGGQ
jgi:hypothetical protein